MNDINIFSYYFNLADKYIYLSNKEIENCARGVVRQFINELGEQAGDYTLRMMPHPYYDNKQSGNSDKNSNKQGNKYYGDGVKPTDNVYRIITSDMIGKKIELEQFEDYDSYKYNGKLGDNTEICYKLPKDGLNLKKLVKRMLVSNLYPTICNNLAWLNKKNRGADKIYFDNIAEFLSK